MNIGELIKNSTRPFFSLEFFPPSEAAQMPAFYETVSTLAALKPLFVSVTYGAGGAKQQRTLEVTGDLAKMGLYAMAHLTCVGAQPEALEKYLHDLWDSGVHNVLALRGDPPAHGKWDWNEGHFRHASDLVTFIKRIIPNMGVGVAVYPSPHPESPTYALDRQHTADKLAAGADFGITQMFFDVREYIDLVDYLREKDIKTPIVPGVLTIQSFDSLKRVLSLCGAKIPAKFYLDLEAANASGGAEAVREEGIKFALEQIRHLLDHGAPGIHLYTLNKSGLCQRIIEESGLA